MFKILREAFEYLLWRPPTGDPSSTRLSQRYYKTFAEEARRGRRLEIGWRTIALVLVAVLVLFVTTYPGVFYYLALIGVFLLLGFIRLWAEGQTWWRNGYEYVFTALDFGLLTFVVLAQNPMFEGDVPPQMLLRYDTIVFYFALLAGLSFTYRPRLVFWGGVIGSLCWAIGFLSIAMHPDSVIGTPPGADWDTVMATMLNKNFVDIDVLIQDVVMLLIVAALLAVNAMRSRRLVYRQTVLERERANLMRFFPPTTVDQLAQRDDVFAEVREQNVAVLFTDLVGFSSWAERQPPAKVIELLRHVHAELEEIVWAHGGTLDKFIGDGLMATFGTPDSSSDDVCRAIACVRDIVRRFDEWNADRADRGEEPVRISVGLHYGGVVVGDIGTQRRLELAVVGDTVNVASRLESLTRSLGCRAAVSGAVVTAARVENPERCGSLVDGLESRGGQLLRGREEHVEVWTL